MMIYETIKSTLQYTPYTKEILQQLIKINPSGIPNYTIDIPDVNHEYPLMYAVQNFKVPELENIIHRLLKLGADPNKTDSYGYNALMEAVRCTGNRDCTENIIQILLDAGTNIDAQTKDGYTALMFSLPTNSFSTLETFIMLLNAGANIHLKDCTQEDVFMKLINYSRGDNKTEMARMLIAAGAKLNGQYYSNGDSLMTRAAGLFSGVSPKMAPLLIQAGVSPNQRSRHSEDTPLMRAINCINNYPSVKSNENEEMVRFLIDMGADIRAKNKYNQTAYDIMIQEKINIPWMRRALRMH